MIRSLALAAALPFLIAATPVNDGANSRVTAISVSSADSGAQLLVRVEGGAVRWSDFVLADPARVVVDIAGARSDLRDGLTQDVRRDGIRAVRTSQWRPDVVRVVIDLDRATTYSVDRVDEGLRISLGGTGTGSAPAPAPAVAAPRSPAPVAVTPVSRVMRRITVTFQEADIRDVLTTFAEFSGQSIVAGSGVQGTVTAEIRDQPWDIALQTILRSHGLDAQELPTGIIRVDAIERLFERAAAEPLVTQTFRINYVPVAELAATIQPLRSDRGSIVGNASTNTLLVTDVERVVDRIGQMIPQLDVRTPQVAIQAKIIFVNRTKVEELGVTYDLKDSRGNALGRLGTNPDPDNPTQLMNRDLVSLGGNSIAALANASSRLQGPALETMTSLVLGRYTLLTFIDALQSAELSDVQAHPLITTVDNQEAEIWVGERTPIRVVDVGSDAGGGAAPRATAQMVETGIRLRVTPHITADRRIFMQLHAERSSAQLAATDIGVVFQTQQGTTRLMVDDGETAVIGGLTVTEVAATRTGIPFLMDIPYVGALFRVSRTREQKRDLLIMVTPHIIDERA
jgi:type IV pilus assembly protein PilQ